tara:strand:- start:41 stop:487 length:447 start_codon:yes stop_codon:yes gene_type:complete
MSFDKKIGVGIGIMLLRDNKILLGKRHEDPKKADSALHGAGTWTMPGGKVDFGETIENAAKRELLEETGIKANSIDLISVSDEILEDVHFVTNGFICNDFEGEAKVLEPNEITEWKWFNIHEVPEKIFFPSEKVLQNFLNKEIYKKGE